MVKRTHFMQLGIFLSDVCNLSYDIKQSAFEIVLSNNDCIMQKN